MLKSVMALFGVLMFLVVPATAQTSSEDEGFEVVATPLEELSAEELAQRQKDAEEAADQACAACGGGMMLMAGIGVAALVLNIALLVWVARDAKSRSMDGSVLWMFLVMLTGLLGLVIYIFSRPQGALAKCSSCNGKRLAASAQCPHCHNA